MNINERQQTFQTQKGLDRKIYRWFRGMLFLTGFYAVITAVAVLSVLWYINSFVIVEDSSQISEKIPTNSSEAFTLTGIPRDVSYLSFSSDGRYCVYLYNGALYVKETATNKEIRKITESVPITNSILMDDRNIIIYFTVNSMGRVTVRTYNIDSDKAAVQKSFNTYPGAKIKQVDYSSSTNLVFLNVVNNSGKSFFDHIYCLNVMKKVTKLSIGHKIENIALLNGSKTLYYQDNNNVLYCHWKPVAALHGIPVKLLGRDSNDNIFVQSTRDRGSFFVLKDATVVKKVQLKDTNYRGIVYNHHSIFVVYSGYVINLTGDSNKKFPISQGMSFINMVGGKLYLRDTNGNVISSSIYIS